MREQEQFLDVIDRDEAARRFYSALRLEPVGEEEVPLEAALERVASRDVTAQVDVPSFDRSNVDGFAVRAADTFGAQEERPRRLALVGETLATGVVPTVAVGQGMAVEIATGGMLPRGADAVVMVEHADVEGNLRAGGQDCPPRQDQSGQDGPPRRDDGARDGRPQQAASRETLLVRKPVTPGAAVAFAGTDITTGEIVVRRGEVLTSRETGVLAAVGVDRLWVWRRPRVAILSTGDEIIAPGEPMRPGLVYDSNARILADAVRELGGEPVMLGIVGDAVDALRVRLREALANADVVLLSGGTSKGAGDLSYRVVAELSQPGIVAHGVALKPGKPICLAVTRGKPVVVLPGFPTSAIFTFHEFVALVIREFGGRPPEEADHGTLSAKLAVKVNSEIGRTEYVLVGLIERDDGWIAYPMGKGSGSVTTFSRADGFVTIDRQTEIVEAEAEVDVRLLSRAAQPADVVVIGSHCAGLDHLLAVANERGLRTKFMAVGSQGGLAAAMRGECDVAGIHLMDEATGEYNRPFVTEQLDLVRGYTRMQGIVYRPGDARFEGRTADEALRAALADDDCMMVNRNQGSGTRVLVDRLLAGARPPGYAVQPRNHHAVAAAVAQGRADWGVAIEWVARRQGLGFLPLQEEQYDFVVPKSRHGRAAVQTFLSLLKHATVRARLEEMGMRVSMTNAE